MLSECIAPITVTTLCIWPAANLSQQTYSLPFYTVGFKHQQNPPAYSPIGLKAVPVSGGSLGMENKGRGS
jgi:hypothetical protein